jgi:transposase
MPVDLLSRVFGINVKSFERYVKRLKEGGVEAFFNPVDNRGKCYIMSAEKLQEAQKLINTGLSQVKIAKQLSVSESAIRAGNLKKKVQIQPQAVPPYQQ